MKAVKQFRISTNEFSDVLTPDGRVAELVYARNRPKAVVRADGSIVIVGGYSLDFYDSVPRYEVFVPSP